MTSDAPVDQRLILDEEALERRVFGLVEAKHPDMAPAVRQQDLDGYVDPARWQQEIDEVFLKFPLALLFSTQLEQAGAFVTMKVLDTPLLITRGEDGQVRAFLNVCSHRGAPVSEKPCGVAIRHTCIYHGWTYDTTGALRGIAEQRTFGDVDKSTLGLVPLPAEEYGGLVWVVLTAGAELDVETHLGDIAPLLLASNLDKYYVAAEKVMTAPNWKLNLETYLEMYHFLTLHEDSVSKRMHPNRMGFDDFSPHQRGLIPQKTGDMAHVLVVFPNLVLAVDPDGSVAEESHPLTAHLILPTDAPDRSITIQRILTRERLETEEDRRWIVEFQALINAAIEGEDLRMAHGIQAGMAAFRRAGRERLFGRCEPGLQVFHNNLERALATARDHEGESRR